LGTENGKFNGVFVQPKSGCIKSQAAGGIDVQPRRCIHIAKAIFAVELPVGNFDDLRLGQ
jgi:hypothetical protein